jgi:hypothetical protein
MDRLSGRLLAGRDVPSILEKEAMLSAVMPRSSRRWLWATAPAVFAAAALSFVLWPRSTGELAARGSSVANARLTLACPTGCGAGHKLIFDLEGTSGYRYFAAFARDRSDEVIWYFPQPNEMSTPVIDVLSRAIVFGPEHTPGIYQVYGVFSDQPLTRDAIKARFDPKLMTAGAGAKVIVRELVVQ